MRGINKSFLLYVVVTMFIVSAAFVWAWINPTANPPGGGGAISVTSSGNVGIGTTAPGAKLEVVGATKFGGIINAVSNRIINLGSPTAGTDATTKDYVDLKGAVGGASTRLWGEGRPNVGLKDNGTSCTNTVGGQTIKLARSDRIAYWDNASAVCPVGWWVCSAAERGTVDCSAAYTTNSHWIRCYANDLSNEYRTSDGSGAEDEPNTNEAWVSDARVMGADPAVILRAPTVGRNGIANSEFLCSILPTWCCANQ